VKLVRSDFEVVVVGAGPAGSAAARAAASGGARTLLLEKHTTIGTPLSCGEGISTTGLTDVLGEIDPRWVCAPIHEVDLYAPDGTRMYLSHPNAGVVLDRKVFDRDVALLAARAGADVRVESPAVGLEANGNGFRSVHIDTPRGRQTVAAKVIIAADGVESQVGRWAGLNTRMKLDRMDSGAQYLLGGVDVKSGLLEFYFGHRVAPGGYAWVFPKGNDSANVGLAVTPSMAEGISARAWLDDFVKRRFKERFTVLEYVVGGIPAFHGHRMLRTQNVLLVGDAARLIDSITGAGIANALLSGDLAGRAASAYVKSGDARALDEYGRNWRRKKGRQMRLYYLAREIFLRMDEQDLNYVIAKLRDHFADRTLSHIDPIETIKTIFRMHRPLLSLVRHLNW
jgi:digeranylgeranylglycerophospholipid reductase